MKGDEQSDGDMRLVLGTAGGWFGSPFRLDASLDWTIGRAAGGGIFTVVMPGLCNTRCTLP